MIYAAIWVVGFVAPLTAWLLYRERRWHEAVRVEYLRGFCDGQIAEAKANHASAMKGRLVQVPLTGVN